MRVLILLLVATQAFAQPQPPPAGCTSGCDDVQPYGSGCSWQTQLCYCTHMTSNPANEMCFFVENDCKSWNPPVKPVLSECAPKGNAPANQETPEQRRAREEANRKAAEQAAHHVSEGLDWYRMGLAARDNKAGGKYLESSLTNNIHSWLEDARRNPAWPSNPKLQMLRIWDEFITLWGHARKPPALAKDVILNDNAVKAPIRRFVDTTALDAAPDATAAPRDPTTCGCDGVPDVAKCQLRCSAAKGGIPLR